MHFRSLVAGSVLLILDVVGSAAAAKSTRHPTTTTTTTPSISLEIMYLQDVSSSFANIPSLIPEITSAFKKLNETYRYSRFGLGTFSDRPVKPFGGENTYCFKLQYPLTHDWDLFSKPLKNIKFHSGGDEAECQLTALAESGRIQLNRWTDIGHEYKTGERIIRIALMVTDSSYHVDGDYKEQGFDDEGKLITIPRPNYVFEDTLPRIISVPSLDSISHDLDEVDYPQVSVVKDILEERDITPIFIVTKNVLSVYEVLVKELRRGHIAVVSDDMKDLGSVVQRAIKNMIKEQIQYQCSSDGSCPCSSPGDCENHNELVVHLDSVPKVIKYSKNEIEEFILDEDFDKLKIEQYDQDAEE